MQRDYEKFPRWRRTLRQKLYYSLLTVENAERDTATLCSGLSRSARTPEEQYGVKVCSQHMNCTELQL